MEQVGVGRGAKLGEQGAICVGPLSVLDDDLPVGDNLVHSDGMIIQNNVPISEQIQITNS